MNVGVAKIGILLATASALALIGGGTFGNGQGDAQDVRREPPSQQAPETLASFPPFVLMLARRDWGDIPKPMSFERLATELSAAVAEGDWKRAISFGDKMHALLPASIPDDFPWSWDVAWSWRAAIGDLYMYDLQFEQAAREYSRVLAEAPESKVYYKDSGARQSAAYGLARALASLGRYKEALVWLRLAPNQLLSGCANCMEVEDRLDHVISTVWEKANLGLDLAADELESIMNGNFQPVPPGLNGDHTDSWIRRAKVEAAFALGQLYLRNGSPWTAIGMFEFVVADGGVERYEVARIAQTYIMRLPGPVPLTQ